MKARPILFNTDMVKAILAGQKTQTRRALKVQPKNDKYRLIHVLASSEKAEQGKSRWAILNKDETRIIDGDDRYFSCPFGQPGDLLYVRETWQESGWPSHEPVMRLYAANPNDHIELQERGLKWRPSIHMPRRASRLTLEITDVRVERLHDLNGSDARAEGFTGGHGAIPGYGYSATPVEHFVNVWDSIYSNWKSNPWVWVVEFKVHHCNVDALLRERGAA